MPDRCFVRPTPFKEFRKPRALIFPSDLPSFPIKKKLNRIALKHTEIPPCRIYLLENAVVLYSCFGASAAALSMEMLIETGSREFLVLGFAGSLDPLLTIGTAVVVDRAFSEEGVSPHYASSNEYFLPSPSLLQDIKNKVNRLSLTQESASIVSTDAPFRETESWLQMQKKKGASLVDMETSAIFSVADFHNVQAASLQLISDELHSGTWKKGFTSAILHQAVSSYFFPFFIKGKTE